jgi:hypothetical protein
MICPYIGLPLSLWTQQQQQEQQQQQQQPHLLLLLGPGCHQVLTLLALRVQ